MKYYMSKTSKEFEGQQQAVAQARSQAETQLKSELGDKYDSTINAANQILKKFGSAEFIQFMDENGLGNHPQFIKLLASISGEFNEDSAQGSGEGNVANEGMAAKAEIDRLIKDPEFQKTLHNRRDPKHLENVALWNKLHQSAYSGQTVEAM